MELETGAAFDRWKAALPSEIGFWQAICGGTLPNAEWVKNFRTLATTGAARRADLTPFLTLGRANRILDVGAGPHTHIGDRGAPTPIEIVPVDPLAEKYAQLLAANRIVPLMRTLPGEAEKLRSYGFSDSFDLVFSRNALDHAYDPINAVSEMLHCCRVGGHVLLEGSTNEGVKQRYKGLHQWNFEPQADTDLVIWNPDTRVSMRGRLGNWAQLSATGDDWYRVDIKRLR